jgi:hypothetical protein
VLTLLGPTNTTRPKQERQVISVVDPLPAGQEC